MNSKLFYIAVPALIASVSVGCARPTVVGKWQGNIPLAGQSLSTTMEFKQDGTMTQTAQSPFGTIVGEGTYKAEGDKLTLTTNSMKMGQRSFPVPPQMKTIDATFKLDGDNLTMNNKGQDIALTRIKDEAAN